MRRTVTERAALSVGQLAQRWCISPDRVRKLIAAGKLPGSFTIPSAGRYGESVKIPLATILNVEAQWAIEPSTSSNDRQPKRRRSPGDVQLKHFPELNASPEPDVECPASDQR